METITTVQAARSCRDAERRSGRRVTLVPTMGALHEGHLSLVRCAAGLGDSVWVSIFVNPTQFGPGEDFTSYPRDLEADLRLLEGEGVDVVFAPAVEEMYPRAAAVRLSFPGLDGVLCGRTRPDHFAGVGLVVSKLFNIIAPDVAVFGQKDAQQALLIRRLAEDLSFPVRVVVAPTVREADGLALSSRNAYLDSAQRSAASVLFHALELARDAVLDGETDPARVESILAETVTAEPLARLEYAACVGLDDLARPVVVDRPVLLALAVRFGSTRLIDNLPVIPTAGE